MLTPEDARKAMPSNYVAQVLDILERDIRDASARDSFSTRLPYGKSDMPEGTPDEIVEMFKQAPNLGYDNARDRTSNAVMLALGVMESRGFKVEFFYEANQFVDMGFRISWEDSH